MSKPSGFEKARVIPLRGRRKTIADRMLASHQSIPHVTLGSEMDATNMVKLREELERENKAHFSYTAILVKAVAKALQAYPILNSTLENNQIEIKEEINIGIAVSIEDGLIVPVIRNADKKPLTQINKEVVELTTKARENKLTVSQVTGGSFTISNLGMFQIDFFTPIIVPGQVAILGIGKISDEPRVIGKRVEVRKEFVASLSFDHRIMDAVVAAKFLKRIETNLGNLSLHNK